MDIYPLYVVIDGIQRVATVEEHAIIKERNPMLYTKWSTKNRISLGKQLIGQGVSHLEAWTQAFDKYPDTNTNRPRNPPSFVVTL